MSYIFKAIADLNETLAHKNQDYRINGEFSNFEFAADNAGVEPDTVMLTQLFIKLGRLKGLNKNPNNETRLDTYKDLAGYAIILYAYALSREEREGQRGGHAEPELVLDTRNDVSPVPGDALKCEAGWPGCNCGSEDE